MVLAGTLLGQGLLLLVCLSTTCLILAAVRSLLLRPASPLRRRDLRSRRPRHLSAFTRLCDRSLHRPPTAPYDFAGAGPQIRKLPDERRESALEFFGPMLCPMPR